LLHWEPTDTAVRTASQEMSQFQVLNNSLIRIDVTHYSLYIEVHKRFISVFNQLDAQNVFHNKFYFMPLHVSSICAHYLVRETATYRCDDTRGCVMQF